MSNTYLANSLEETRKIAAELAETLKKGTVLGLCGPLGAGKTAFTQGLTKQLHIKDTVNSPTFTIINEYTNGPLPIYHIDLYRLTSYQEALNTGLTEYLPSNDGITIVEWADHIPEIMPKNFLKINIKIIENNQREISIYENFSF